MRLVQKLFFMLCIIGLLGIFTGCGSATGDQKSAQSSSSNSTVSEQNTQSNAVDLNGKKILIAYFSKTGHTEKVAQEIQKQVGGDLVKIETVKPYPDDYKTTTEVAKAEKDNDERPEISTKIDNMNDYDVIFIGYPIWWHTAPMAVYTFLESYDLSGKTVIPFCTSGGSDISESMPAIEKLCADSTILKGLTANDIDDVAPWLKEIGIHSAD